MLNIYLFAEHKMGQTHIWLVPWDAVLLSLWDVVMLLIFSTYNIRLLTEYKPLFMKLFEGRALCNWPIWLCSIPVLYYKAARPEIYETRKLCVILEVLGNGKSKKALQF
jgi:hypothetical protein